MDIAAALLSGFPGTKWKLEGNDYAKLDWRDPSPKPTLEQLEDAWEQIITPEIVVSRRSFLLALGSTRYFAIRAVIESLTYPEEKYEAEVYLSSSMTFARRHPMVIRFAEALGKTETEVDEIFADAKERDNLGT